MNNILNFHSLRYLVVACAWISCVSLASAQQADWKVGVAKTIITPSTPIHLVGYGGRDDPFSRVDTEIYAKALAFEDAQGYQAVLVTADLVGFPDIFFNSVCQRITKKTGLSRAQIMLNASHNHTGPLLSLKPSLEGNLAYSAFSPTEAQHVIDYTQDLQEKIYQLVLTALDDLQPANLSWATDRVAFVMNRRIKTKQGTIRMGPNPTGPIDPIVPVLKVAGADGKIRALLFGCACHNTGLTGDHNIITGDYAGYAQEILEKRYPGAIALFKSGCGADANPEPRTDVAGVRIHGLALADAVTQALAGNIQPIAGNLRCAIRKTNLPLRTYQPGQIEALAVQTDTVGLMAKHLLQIHRAGAPLRTTYPAHIAAWSFGKDLTLVAFPSETVSKFALSLRAEYPQQPLWISAYNNDFFGYIPTAKIVREGGHEAIGVTTWLWGTDLTDHVGFFSEAAEQVMLETARELIQAVNPTEED